MSGRAIAIEHVQLAMPVGGEDAARRFYDEVLGLSEVPKPAALAGRGGVWFESHGIKLHLGADRDFRPATRAHPAILVRGLSELLDACARAGHIPEDAVPIEGFARAYVHDPFGNRIELMERTR